MSNRSWFRFPPAVVYLGLVSLMADIASEMIYPILPFFLTGTLGVSVLFVGALEGIAEAVASVTKVTAGYYSDRVKNKAPIVFVGYLISTCRSFMSLATAPWQILAIRFSDRIGKGIRSAPRDSWLASYTNSQNRGRIFGFHRGMDHLGATLAPLLATAFLYFLPGEYRLLFAITFIPGLLSLIFVVKAAQVDGTEKGTLASESTKLSIREAVMLPKKFWYFMFVLFVFTLGNSADAFLLLRLKDLGVPEYLIPALWAGLSLVKMLSSFWGGSFSDRVGAKVSISLGWAIYALVFVGLAVSSTAVAGTLIFLFYGIFFGLSEAPEKVIVTQLVPQRLRGTGFGFYYLIVGLGLLPASLIFGWIWLKFSAELAFYFGASCAVLGLILIWFLKTDDEKATPQFVPTEVES